MRRVVVLGGGFAGLTALKTLKDELSALRRVEITIVSDRAHFVATPLLSKVATGGITLRQATAPLSRFTGKNVNLEIDRIESIDFAERTLRGRHEHPFDYLILAPGSTIDWRGAKLDQRAIAGRDAQQCVDVYERVKIAFETASATADTALQDRLLTFVICGGGPCGVELAANLSADLSKRLFPKYDPRLVVRTRIVLLETSDRLLQNFSHELGDRAHALLHSLGVEVRVGTSLQTFVDDTLSLSDGTQLETRNLIWCGGTRPHPLSMGLDEREVPHVKGTLESTTHAGVFVAGDCSADRAVRRNAYHAVDQGIVAARNVVAQLSGRSPRRFEDRIWPTVLELGDHFLVHTNKNAILEGRPARVYAASNRTKLLGPWMGRLTMLKNMARVMASRAPESIETALIGFEWD